MATAAPAGTPAMKRVIFAPYDLTETRPHKKASATAFAVIRRALFQSGGKPTNPELAGAWRIGAELQMVISDLEFKHEEDGGALPDANSPSGMRMIKVPVIVLNPAGAQFVASEQHVQQLRAIFDEWVKSNGKNSEALSIHLAYQWFNDPANIMDASTEPAIASGAVAPLKAPPVVQAPAVPDPSVAADVGVSEAKS